MDIQIPRNLDAVHAALLLEDVFTDTKRSMQRAEEYLARALQNAGRFDELAENIHQISLHAELGEHQASRLSAAIRQQRGNQ